MIQLPEYKHLKTEAFSAMFTNMQNSYKLFWFKSIFDSVIESETTLNTQALTNQMIELSFPFVHDYKLSFGGADQIESMLKTIKENYKGRCHYKSICKAVAIDSEIKLRKAILNYVPYRLLSVFYHKSKTVDNLKNKRILKLSNEDEFAFYKIDMKNNQIIIHPLWAKYIITNQGIILAWYKYHLTKFLQRRNPSSPNIPSKVDSTRQDIKDQRTLWLKAIKRNPNIDFDIYLEMAFSIASIDQYGRFSLDHILPFNFISHDQIWNLVPIHKNINSSKGTSLPNFDQIAKAVGIQYRFFETVRNFDDLSQNEINILKEYEILNPDLNYMNTNLDELTFSSILSKQLESLHTIASNQGFEIWNS